MSPCWRCVTNSKTTITDARASQLGVAGCLGRAAGTDATNVIGRLGACAASGFCECHCVAALAGLV
jgi:hypothetical protein